MSKAPERGLFPDRDFPRDYPEHRGKAPRAQPLALVHREDAVDAKGPAGVL